MSEPLFLPSSGTEPKSDCPSSTVWIIMFIIFLLIAVGLGIWLIVLYARGTVGDKLDRLLTLIGPKIRVTNITSITGSWTGLNKPTDIVTLYVSDSTFDIAADGKVSGPGLQKQTGTGNSGSINISVNPGNSYGVMMIVTADDTVNYRVYGPMTVFTQTQPTLVNNIFNIRSLGSCDGAVSESGSYTTFTDNIGFYSYGRVNTSTANTTVNETGASFLVKHDHNTDNTIDENETDMVLCRTPGSSQVALYRWANKGSYTDRTPPIICPPGSTGSTCPDTAIANDNCSWSYNQAPSGVEGENRWCLSTAQPTVTNGSTQTLCLKSSDNKTLQVDIIPNSEKWFNQLTGTRT